MNVEYLSIIFADYFTLRNLSTSLHFVQTRYAVPTFIRISWKQRKCLLHINEESKISDIMQSKLCDIMQSKVCDIIYAIKAQ